MEVKIGIAESARELVISSKEEAAKIQAVVSDVFAGKSAHLELDDDKGRRFLVPAERIAYVELGASDSRRVGFGS